MKADPHGVLTGVHFIDGDHAACEGALAAGARFAAGYPITPSTEVVERFAARIPTVGGVFIQMEDELAASIAIQGAVWGGAKAFTVTSGPGFSLMMEHIGYAAMTETPCVFVDVQRPAAGAGAAVGALASASRRRIPPRRVDAGHGIALPHGCRRLALAGRRAAGDAGARCGPSAGTGGRLAGAPDRHAAVRALAAARLVGAIGSSLGEVAVPPCAQLRTWQERDEHAGAEYAPRQHARVTALRRCAGYHASRRPGGGL